MTIHIFKYPCAEGLGDPNLARLVKRHILKSIHFVLAEMNPGVSSRNHNHFYMHKKVGLRGRTTHDPSTKSII